MRLFSCPLLLGMSTVLVSLAQEMPADNSCKVEGDANPLLQVHVKGQLQANETDDYRLSPWCFSQPCQTITGYCLAKRQCCELAKACAWNGGGSGGGGGNSKCEIGSGKCGMDYQTSITVDLNNKITPDTTTQKVYEGGAGVLFRNQNDGFFGNDAFNVLPGSLIVNDIFAPNPVYPTNPNTGSIDPDQAVLGVIFDDEGFNNFFGPDTQSYDYSMGVFYASDSNAVDKRCRDEEDPAPGQYNCRLDPTVPGAQGYISQSDFVTFTADAGAIGTAGYDMGNPRYQPPIPNSGGGTGCHASTNGAGQAELNQWDAKGEFAGIPDVNIAKNLGCECNDVFIGFDDCKPWIYSGHPTESNCWDRWIYHWMLHGGADVHGTSFPVDNIGYRDNAACWMTNIRSMINLQNWFWLMRDQWTLYNKDAHTYWGWNEIPVRKSTSDDPQRYESLAIFLPEGVGSLNEFDATQKANLEMNMDWYFNAGYLVPGEANVANRPGSYVVIAKQIPDSSGNGNYGQFFYCENAVLFKYKIVFNQMAGADPGACYIDYA